MGLSAAIHRINRSNWTTCSVVVLVLVLAGMSQIGSNTAFAADTGIDEIHTDFGDNASTTMWVHWRGTAQTVSYGTTTSYGSTSSSSVTLPAVYNDTVNGVPTTIYVPLPTDPSAASSSFQRIQLTGLTAGLVYHYKIGAAGLDHTFKTAPSGDYTWDDIGDTATTAFDPNADASCNKPWMSSVWADVAADAPDFVTHGGDINYANACGTVNIHQFYQDIAPIATTRAFEQVWGNHEYGPLDPTTAPAGTPAHDSMTNYKSRSYTPNPITVLNDSSIQLQQEGCPGGAPQLLTATQNACQGSDWGSFTVGHVLYITAPEPWFQSYTDWQTGADALMSTAMNNTNIYMIVTLSHRPAYSSIIGGLDQASSEFQFAVNALGDKYGTGVAGGKYVMNIAHHVHGSEIITPQHGVWQIVDGGGGTEETTYGTAVPGSIFTSAHLAHLNISVTSTVTGGAASGQMTLNFICGPIFTPNPTKDACIEGEVISGGSAVINTSPYTPPPPATTCAADILPVSPTSFITNPSLELGQTPWTGSYSNASNNVLHSNDTANACDGYSALLTSMKPGFTPPLSIGVNPTTDWVTNSTAGYTYTGKVHVKSNIAGRVIHLQIQQKNVGTGVTTNLANVTVTPSNTTAWNTITTAGTATESGDSILFKVYMDATATTDSFYSDGFSLTAASPPPPISPQTTCQDIHSGDLVTNRSLETDTTGWAGVLNTSSIELWDNQNACDGSFSLKTLLVPNAVATNIGFVSKPTWVASTVANTTYTAKVWVKSANVGKKLKLTLQEWTPDGKTAVGSATTSVLATGGSTWNLLTIPFTALNAGDNLDFKVYINNPGANDVFWADNMSLLATAGIPPIGNQVVCSDTNAANETLNNRSVEADISGWDVISNKSTVNWDNTQACDGLRSIGVTNASGAVATTLGFDSASETAGVTSTSTGSTYTGSVWLRAAAIGTIVEAQTQERDPSNSNVGEKNILWTAPDTAWHKVTVPTYTAAGNGNWIDFKVYVNNAADGVSFNADKMSLTTTNVTVAPFSHACDDAPTGFQTVGNRSAENNLTGWTGKYTAASTVTNSTSILNAWCEGSWVVHVTNNSGATTNIGFQNPTPYWVNNSTVINRVYTASAWVRAAAGQTIHVSICQRTATSTDFCTTDNYVAINTGYHLRSTKLTSTIGGRSIQMKIYEDNAPTTGYLDADNMSLTY